MLINITGGMDLTIDEVTTIASIIQEAAGDDAEIIFGAVHDPALEGELRVTVIATGLDREELPLQVDNVIRPTFGSRTTVCRRRQCGRSQLYAARVATAAVASGRSNARPVLPGSQRHSSACRTHRSRGSS